MTDHEDLIITGSGRGRGNTTIGGILGGRGGNLGLSRRGQNRLNRLTASGRVTIGRDSAAFIRSNARANTPMAARNRGGNGFRVGGGPTAASRRAAGSVTRAARAASGRTRPPRRRPMPRGR